jgi:hypothetical protein
MNADGKDIHTISVNNVTEFDPCVLPDGRLMFGRWEYIDRNALVIQSLWTILPDGRNESELFANNMVFPEAVLQAKPVKDSDYLVVATFTPHNAPPRGTIAMIDMRMGKDNPEAITNFECPDKPTYDRGDSCDPWALNRNVVLYSSVPEGKNTPSIPVDTEGFRKRNNPKLNVLMLIDRTGKRVVVHSDPAIDLHNPIIIEPRPLPRIIADVSARTQYSGKFFVNDVYVSMPTVKRGTVKWLRVLEETSRVSESPGGNGMNQTFSISAALAWSAKIYHGIVPVEPDGSVFFEAPSGRALYFQLLDQDYRLVRGMRTFIQAVPGVTRSCTGCHEYNPKGARLPRLANRIPVRLRDESWGSGYLDYSFRVQPIFDDKCVSCHGGVKGMAAGLDLSRGRTDLFNISYEHLTARREKMYTADLIAGICAMNGTAYWSCKVFGPYSHGSGKGPLADILLKEPHKSRLTQKEREQIFAWMDSNGVYFGTWDYTKAGPHSRPFLNAVSRVKEVMKEARCTDCHASEQGVIKRFDQWINLDIPEMSRVLRAPLPVSTTAEGGYGLALCRDRKVDQTFSRRGLIYGFGYAHAVMDLDKFPTQTWSKVWPPEGKSVTPFESINNPYYRKILTIIKDAQTEQLATPRVDMPNADIIGEGVFAGRPRQILPQPLPTPAPTVTATPDENGFVRIKWESSVRMIGLITEIHRGPDEYFSPGTNTQIGRSERFEYCDTNPPPGKVNYAIVFVSDPAETCGTVKSGAVFDYQHEEDKPSVVAIRNERCPFSTFVPVRSSPIRLSVEVPPLLPALSVSKPGAEPREGKIMLRWQPVGIPGITTYDVFGKLCNATSVPQKINSSPLRESYFQDALFHEDNEVSYAVLAWAPRNAEPELPKNTEWVSAKALPRRIEPVFILSATNKNLKLSGKAKFANDVLNLPAEAFVSLNQDPDMIVDGPFSFVLETFFDEPGKMPVLLGFGPYGGAGWFLQKIGGKWRFHLSGVSCDGGNPPVGEWLRVVGVYDGKKARIYENGRQVAECVVPGIPKSFDQQCFIGQYSSHKEEQFEFRGKIRKFLLYSRVLNSEGK